MSLTGKGGRPPGLPKTGGRQKGTPNKATQTVAEKLDALGCDPIEGMARIAMNERIPSTCERVVITSSHSTYTPNGRQSKPQLRESV